MRQQRKYSLLQLLGNLLDGQTCINPLKTIFCLHHLELLKQACLVIDEALEKVSAQAHIHTGFPVIKAAALQDTRHQVCNAYLQIEDGIGLQRQPVNRTNPVGVSTPHNSTSYQRINIAVCQHDEAGTQGGQDLAFETIYKVRGIEQV